MSSRDEQWWDLQAGELVLGTLADHERELFESIRRRDPEFQRRVTAWQERLSAFDLSLQPRPAPERIWKGIESRLGFSATGTDFSESILNQTAALEQVQHAFSLDDTLSDETAVQIELSSPGAEAERGSESPVTSAQQGVATAPAGKVNIWRDLTILTTAACLVLAIVAWNAQSEKNQLKTQGIAAAGPQISQFDTVSIVANELAQPLWVINAVTDRQKLQVSAIGPPAIDNSSAYQLWMHTASDPDASAIGLLPLTTGETLILDSPALSQDAVAFSVSLEAAGGSLTGRPNGPMVYRGKIHFLTF